MSDLDTCMENGRTGSFRRNLQLEQLLTEINELVGPAEDEVAARFDRPRYPVVLVVGGPRSGSTLMMQWLARLDLFACPTNLLSRFYRAPFIGAKIQQLLADPRFGFRDEIPEFRSSASFASDLGKTSGALEPNDFWYFWRRFFPNTEPVWLDNEALEKVDRQGFLAELAALESVFDKPIAMKAMIVEQNIPFLSSLFDGVLFLNVKRHPFFNIQSLLEAREKFFGDLGRWYSIRPREYDDLIRLDPIAQVAGQVYFKNRAVEDGLRRIPVSRQVEIDYEEFCRSPQSLFAAIARKLEGQGYPCRPDDYDGPTRFESANTVRLSPERCNAVVEAYRWFSGVDIRP